MILSRLRDELQGYLQHKITCPANPANDIIVNGLPWKHCTCGLDQCLTQLDPLLTRVEELEKAQKELP